MRCDWETHKEGYFFTFLDFTAASGFPGVLDRVVQRYFQVLLHYGLERI